MLVTVKIYYYEVFGKGLIELNLNEGATVRDVLDELNEKFGDKFKEKTGRDLKEAFKSLFNLFLNGRRLDPSSDLGCKLKDGDKIVILRPVSGGMNPLFF